MGHVIRSLAIASHLRSIFKAQVVFRTNPDPVPHRLIEAGGFPLSGAVPLGAVTESSKPEARLDAWMVDVHEDGPDIVGGLRTEWPDSKLFAMDFSNFKSHCPDTIINLRNPNLDGDTPPEWVDYHEGLEYAVIREEFRPYRDLPKGNGSLTNLLVCFGSSDIGNNTQTVLAGASLAALTEATYHVVIGPNVEHRETVLKQVRQSHLSVKVHEQPQNLPQLMAGCNLAFCGGGTTMLELAFLGVPSVGVGQTQQEEGLAKLLEEQGAIMSAGRAGTCQPGDIAELLASLGSQPQRLQGMEHNGRRLVDGKGIERIASLLAGCTPVE